MANGSGGRLVDFDPAPGYLPPMSLEHRTADSPVIPAAEGLGLPLDVQSIQRMLQLDQCACRVDQGLRARLRLFVLKLQEKA
jgi:hypothetical protein